MNTKELKALLTDWRVATLIILVILSVVAIYPHFDQNGNLASNLQYGLDLQQGAWIQLEMKGEVVGFTTTQPLDTFVANLSNNLAPRCRSSMRITSRSGNLSPRPTWNPW